MTAIAEIRQIDTRAEKYQRWNRKLNRSWSSADYARIGVTLQMTGERLAEAVDFTPGSRILDVAAGNGNASLALARRFCAVTSTDYVPDMLDKGRARAEAEGLEIAFEVADAQNLPYGDASFDGVISTFGTMFAPDQQATAAELIRVCKPGGKIALACWTPLGFVGRVCATIGRHMGAGGDFKSPQNWGREDWLREQFGPAAADMTIRWREHSFRYPSPRCYLDFFRTHYGLCRAAFAHVGTEGEKALEDDILGVVDRFNVAADGSMNAPSEYAEVVLVRK